MAKAEASKEVRRKQLIDATMRAIGRYGYASLTLTHVAGEAGLSLDQVLLTEHLATDPILAARRRIAAKIKCDRRGR